MKKTKKQLEGIAKKVKLLILDVDGVLTDGRIILDNEGNEFKAFNVRDGHGIRMLIKAGIHVAIITGRDSRVVVRRAKELGITEVYQGQHKKADTFDHLIKKLKLSKEEAAYIGDDIVDIPIFIRAGLAVAVSDATDEAKAYAMMVTEKRGGKGAVREVSDFLLKAKGVWESVMREYLEV